MEGQSLRESGMVLKRPTLKQREVAIPVGIRFPKDQAVIDTIKSQEFLCSWLVHDSKSGDQSIRIVKTISPYSPDFSDAAHKLIFILPENSGQAIVTPLDGDERTWQQLFKINKQVAQQTIRFYAERGLKDVQVIIGLNASPYTKNDYLKTQSVKAAHSHIFLIGRSLIQRSSRFTTRGELRSLNEEAGSKRDDINKDIRRFFPTKLQQAFNQAATTFVIHRLSSRTWGHLGMPNSVHVKEGAFPISGIQFHSMSLEMLESPDYFEAIRSSYAALDEFYKNVFMPIFISNYQDAIGQSLPNPSRLQFNTLQEAVRIFDGQMIKPEFAGISEENKAKWRRYVGRLANNLSSNKPDLFSFGPAFSVSTLYNPTNDDLDLFINYTPFGGGSLEALGIDKIRPTQEEQKKLEEISYSPENVSIEEALDQRIRANLAS